MNKLITKKRLIIFCLYFLLAIIIFCSFDIYFFGYKNHLSKFVTKIIPYPALIINNEIVTINEYEFFLKDYRSYLLESNKADYEFNNSLIVLIFPMFLGICM